MTLENSNILRDPSSLNTMLKRCLEKPQVLRDIFGFQPLPCPCSSEPTKAASRVKRHKVQIKVSVMKVYCHMYDLAHLQCTKKP